MRMREDNEMNNEIKIRKEGKEDLEENNFLDELQQSGCHHFSHLTLL